MVKDKIKAGIYEGIEEDLVPFYEALSSYIVSQRKRLPQNWAIANAVFSRTQRETLRRQIGPELVFIVLNLTKDCQKKRCQSRMGGGGEGVVDMFTKMFDMYEPAGDDEENAFNIIVTEEMTVEDVEKKVLEIVAKFE